MREAVIVSGVRTGIGGFNGKLTPFSATQLGGMVIEEAIRRAGLDKEAVDEVIMGNVLPHGLGQNPARQACFKAGLPYSVGALTINKVCGSGLKAVMLAAQAVQTGDADVVVAGGMESMTNVPYIVEKVRFGLRMGDGELVDAMIHDGLWDINNDFHMGYAAELTAEKFKVSREEMDKYALRSYQLALQAHRNGYFKDEIMEIKVPQRKGDPVPFATDEPVRETSLERLANLKPVFKRDGGSVTAGNSSKLADGAAAVVVTSLEFALKNKLPIMAKIVAQASAGLDPKDVLVAPILAVPKVLKKAGMSIGDIELFEVNEAFASSTVAVMRELEIPEEILNVNGGAIALGHPIGASGARVLVTLLYSMRRLNKKRGLATLCLGGGEAVAMIVERDEKLEK